LRAVGVRPHEVVARVHQHTHVVDVVRLPLLHVVAGVVPPREQQVVAFNSQKSGATDS